MAIKTYAKTSKVALSRNFKASEFKCKGQGCCTAMMIDTDLVSILQRIRDHFGAPVTINSAFRCQVHNKRVGGKPGSYHTKGQAADIVVKGVDPIEVAQYAESIKVKGIGLYETDKDGYFVHVDTRKTKSYWYGQSQKKVSTFLNEDENDDDEYPFKQFVKDVQAACGAKVDGIPGPETLSKTVTVTAKYNRKHAVVLPIQKYLYALGYTEIGEADGIAGAKFTSAVAHFQQDNGCTVDGKIHAKQKTWKKLLKLG